MAGTLEKIKKRVGYYQLNKWYDQHHSPREVINLNDANNIGVIFNATHSVNFEIIRQLSKKLTKQNKSVHILGYVHSKSIIDHYLYRKGFDFFSKKDLNWYFKPKNETITDFTGQSFDILMNLSLEEYLPIQYIMVRSNARLKVSPLYENEDARYADILIDINRNREEYENIRKSISDENKMTETELEHDIDEITLSEIQLNFLIEQVLHYLSLIKSHKTA